MVTVKKLFSNSKSLCLKVPEKAIVAMPKWTHTFFKWGFLNPHRGFSSPLRVWLHDRGHTFLAVHFVHLIYCTHSFLMTKIYAFNTKICNKIVWIGNYLNTLFVWLLRAFLKRDLFQTTFWTPAMVEHLKVRWVGNCFCEWLTCDLKQMQSNPVES